MQELLGGGEGLGFMVGGLGSRVQDAGVAGWGQGSGVRVEKVGRPHMCKGGRRGKSLRSRV